MFGCLFPESACSLLSFFVCWSLVVAFGSSLLLRLLSLLFFSLGSRDYCIYLEEI